MSECIFCRIRDGELPCKKVYEDEDVLAFHDIHPKAPVHVLVIPKRHVATFSDADEALLGRLMDRVRHVADAVLGLQEGWRLIVNVRAGGGQEVYHLHAHILGGRRLPF